ncbi:MAG TPA: DinB family protein [Longimicrobiaceae bacterium]|nr:DinB family protein [Longimicrobiaceae bacterium]
MLELLERSDVARSAESLRLFAHLLAAERIWLLRLRGEDSAGQPIWPDLPLVELNATRAANETDYTRYLQTLTHGDLQREIEYGNSRGVPFRTSVLDVLTHVALHGSYHRGQIARAMRSAGEEPVNTDYIAYARESMEGGD